MTQPPLKITLYDGCTDAEQGRAFHFTYDARYDWLKQCALAENRARADDIIRPRLYGVVHPRQPYPRAALFNVTFNLFLSKIQPAVYIRIANPSRGARQLGWTSCLTSACRVTLPSGTTFLHLIRIANPSRGARQLGWTSCLTSACRVTLPSGTTFLHLNALARKINSAKPTVIVRPRDICTIDYLVSVINNHAGLTLTRPTGTTFSHINAR